MSTARTGNRRLRGKNERVELAVVLSAIQSGVELVDHHRRDSIVISRTVHPDPQRGVPTFAAGLGVWNGWREHRHSAATATKRAGVLRPVAATVTASRCRSRISFSPICNTGMPPLSKTA